VLLAVLLVLAGASAHAGSPLTLSILQDNSVQVTQLNVGYVRQVKCEKPDLPPDANTVTEKGTLQLGGNKTFYISETKIADHSQHICFMPEQTVETTTGSDSKEVQTIPAQTWNQTSQKLDITKIDAAFRSARVAVDSACLGGGKLDTENNRKVLKIREVGSLSSKTKGGKAGAGKLGGGSVQARLECQATP